MKNTLWSKTNETYMSWMNNEDWFNLGKADAWADKPKRPPEDAQAASMYDLGYSEGGIKHSPMINNRR